MLIFGLRIIDVSIGTIRIIYVSKGMSFYSAACGFFEVLIWLIAITQIMQNMTNVIMYIAYAGGFATGNIVGIFIESKLAVGYVALRIITEKDATSLVNYLRANDYGVTVVGASGLTGRVRIVFTIIRRKNLSEVIDVVKQYNPASFFSIEDVRSVSSKKFYSGKNKGSAWAQHVKKMK
jgi:uncharacterized protein YebE (UPF0316 family)